MPEPQTAVADETPAPRWSEEALAQASLPELVRIGRELGLDSPGGFIRRGLLFRIHHQLELPIVAEGVLETLPDGFGFLRSADTSYLADSDDVYVSPSQIRRHGLLAGDTLSGIVRAPRNGERYFALAEVERVNLQEPSARPRRDFYADLTPLHPMEAFRLEHPGGEISTRILDLMCPLGKGQRALIVSPPRAGKTILLQNIAHAIAANHPEVVLIVLLIDERPEEVTDMRQTVQGEVVSSTFDEPASRHTAVAEVVIDKARRLAEQGRDVVILLDSITRLARAYNTMTPSSGRVLSGGVDSKALHKPKRFFGSARQLSERGSLTIIATALVDTGSRMEEVIFEEFKGTGNSEIVLSRQLGERRIWPAIDINRSGTRKEELLLGPDVTRRVWLLRKILQPMGAAEAMQLLVQRLGQTESNQAFLESMNLLDDE